MKQLLVLVAALLIAGCKPKTPSQSATVRNVSLESTDVRDQGSIGFCWAYSITALAETLYLQRTGQKISLSEEALGLTRIITGLMHAINVSKSKSELNARIDKIGAGFSLREDKNQTSTSASGIPIDGIDLVEFFGLWPETAYPIKFPHSLHKHAVLDLFKARKIKISPGEVLLARIKSRMKFHVQASDLDFLKKKKVEAIRAALFKVKTGPVKADSVDDFSFQIPPPSNFFIKGPAGNHIAVTPKTYAKEVIGVNWKNFILLNPNSQNPKNLDRTIYLLRYLLELKIPIPIGFGINDKLQKKSSFTARNASREDLSPDLWNGGHGALITGYKNFADQEGKNSACARITAPPTQLDHFIIKNSWGKGPGLTEQGVPTDASDGYYKMDREYLREAFATAKLLEFVVPGEISKMFHDGRDISRKLNCDRNYTELVHQALRTGEVAPTGN